MKSTRFSLESNQVYFIEPLKDMTKEDLRSVWYNAVDVEAMMQPNLALIRKMMKGEMIEETNVQTVRGLEYRTREGAIRRQKNKLKAWKVVLDEQDRQERQGFYDDDLLAELYRACSAHCQESAFMRGWQDQAVCQSDDHTETCVDLETSNSSTHEGPIVIIQVRTKTAKLPPKMMMAPRRSPILASIPPRQMVEV